MRFEFAHSHAYPGCRLRTTEDGVGPRHAEDLVEFSDGSVAAGRHEVRDGTIVLHVGAYTTARGTRIAARSWRLEPDGDEGRWRVRARLADGSEDAG